MNIEIKETKMLDRYFYSIFTYGNGEKAMHLSGNIYENDVDETDMCFRCAEWIGFEIPLKDVIFMVAEGDFYDYINEKVRYLGNMTKEEATYTCSVYFGGEPGTKLSFKDITLDMPDGEYYS